MYVCMYIYIHNNHLVVSYCQVLRRRMDRLAKLGCVMNMSTTSRPQMIALTDRHH